MAKKRKGPTPRRRENVELEPEQLSMWVQSDVLPNGSYATTIGYRQDVARTLNREEAIEYAVMAIARSVEAEHDFAVFTMFTSMGADEKTAVEFLVRDIRHERVEYDEPTKPFIYRPGVGRKGPFVHIEVVGKGKVGEISTKALRDHATGVLMAYAAADFDNALYRALAKGKDGAGDDSVARGSVGLLKQYWPTEEQQDRQD